MPHRGRDAMCIHYGNSTFVRALCRCWRPWLPGAITWLSSPISRALARASSRSMNWIVSITTCVRWLPAEARKSTGFTIARTWQPTAVPVASRNRASFSGQWMRWATKLTGAVLGLSAIRQGMYKPAKPPDSIRSGWGGQRNGSQPPTPLPPLARRTSFAALPRWLARLFRQALFRRPL